MDKHSQKETAFISEIVQFQRLQNRVNCNMSFMLHYTID